MISRREFSMRLLGTLGTTAVAGCSILDRVRKRFKANLVIEINGVKKSAAGIYEFHVPFNLGAQGWPYIVGGTAPLVDLDGRGHIFWRLGGGIEGSDNYTTLAMAPLFIYPGVKNKWGDMRDYSRIANAEPSERELPSQRLPSLTFVHTDGTAVGEAGVPNGSGNALLSEIGGRLVRATIAPSNSQLITRVQNPPRWLLESRNRGRRWRSLEFDETDR